MIQSMSNSHPFALNSLAQSTPVQNTMQGNFNNQICPSASIPTVGISQNQAFTPQNFMPMQSVPFTQQSTSQNFLYNSAENQQNLMCYRTNNYLNNYPIGIVGGQNQYQTSNYLGQNVNLPTTDTQQSMLQLQMMNMKYKQIIQQQQQQLKQMQMQQLQQSAQQQQQQQQQFNQGYPQQILNPFNSPNNSINQMNFINTNAQPQSGIQTCLNTPYSNVLQKQTSINTNGLSGEQKDVIYTEMNKIKVEAQSQSQQGFTVSIIEKQKQLLSPTQQNFSSPLSIPCQSPLAQQQYLNTQSNLLSAMMANVSQNGHLNGDFISQPNKLNTSQSSLNTVKIESNQNSKVIQFSQDHQMQNNNFSQRQTFFSTSNSKLEEIQQSFEGIINSKLLNPCLNEQSQLVEDNKNYENSSYISEKKLKRSRSQQNNMEIDTQSHSQYACNESYNKHSNELDDVICKKRFTQVKQEDEQMIISKQSNSDVKATNIPQLQDSKKRFSNSILSTSASAFCEKSSMLSNSESGILKEDPQYLEFSRLSSFDNIQEAQKSFDKLIKKLSINQMIECVLSHLPARPEETTNFENKFVNSMKAKQSKDKRNPNALYMTRFHNLTRLLMYNIVQLFSFDILTQNLNIHFYIAQELENICRKIKQHARQTCNGQFKTDFYTHSHYNGLFLVLDNNTISHIKKSQKDIEIHQQVYGLDIQPISNQDENENFEIKKCNFFKILAHEILMRCSYQSVENSLINGDDARRIYFRRALSGISKLNKGQVVHRF
ncbi:hypothetical protein ABPG72_005641 [Tetrahymena utriculariae]